MLKILFLSVLFLFSIASTTMKDEVPVSPALPDDYEIFMEMQLAGKVSYEAFEQALTGYREVGDKKKELLTLIDFTKPSTDIRLFVLDMKERKILYESHVSHGRNSGENFATSFSNEMGSCKSSLGFFLTSHTYTGRNGYSLLLDGLEKGINDRARARAIVIHGAPYSDPSVIRYSGRLGRSQGCPALPLSICKPIINTIKEGSLLYIYADDSRYIEDSPILSVHSS